jgi:PAS domain S-box-containing protein
MRHASSGDKIDGLRVESTTQSMEAARSLARESPGLLFLIADGKVVYANGRGEEALGVSREEERSRYLELYRIVVVAPEYLGVSQEMFRRRSRGEAVSSAAYALLTRDGRRIEGVLTIEFVRCQGRRHLLGLFTAQDALVQESRAAPHTVSHQQRSSPPATRRRHTWPQAR